LNLTTEIVFGTGCAETVGARAQRVGAGRVLVISDRGLERTGVIGLSWGSFYALVTAALEPRIRVTLASGFFNDRYMYDRANAVWFDSGNRFLDAEIAALVWPRPLYVEVGQADDLFDVQFARPAASQVAACYERLGMADRFRYQQHPGGHECARSDDGLEFVYVWLRSHGQALARGL